MAALPLALTVSSHPAATELADPPTRRLLTVREAARMAGCAENTLRRWIRCGADDQLARALIQLPGGHLRIRRAAFERWLDDRDPEGRE